MSEAKSGAGVTMAPAVISTSPVDGTLSRRQTPASPAEIAKIVGSLAALPDIKPSEDRAWKRPPAVRVIDCVLSLNRNYDRFVVPRLDEFERHRPQILSVNELKDAIEAAPTSDDFVRENLNYRDPGRARILEQVSSWLATVAGDGDHEAQLHQLEKWAADADAWGFRQANIRGFGIAGWQYLRMLFGANTTKPDVHIIRFVEGLLGRKVKPAFALEVLELASRDAKVSLRDLDTTIWENAARETRAPG